MNRTATAVTSSPCAAAIRQPRTGTSNPTTKNARGTTKAIIDARTADQIILRESTAWVRNAQAAASSLGTKNEARRPIVIQYAITNGAQRVAVRGYSNEATSRVVAARTAMIKAAPSA